MSTLASAAAAVYRGEMRLALTLVAVAACGSHTNSNVDGNHSVDGASDTYVYSGNDGQTSIYAHTSSTLYRVDPDSLAITMVGDFNFTQPFEQMTDLAIDKNGQLVGVSFFSVYTVDPVTAKVTQLSSSLSRSFNGLSFVPADLLGMTGDDVLIGTENTDGNVYSINPMTGATTQAGSMGAFVSSGDLVAVEGFGMMQTVKGSTHDKLARLAPQTFAATVIGTDTGFDQIWGLGFWKGTLFGFTNSGQFITIDPSTGVGTLVAANGPAWFGAAVTTVAPIIE